MKTPAPVTVIPFALEQLFVDQERDWVIDTIAPVLAWVPGKTKARMAQPFRFAVEHIDGNVRREVHVDLTWDLAKLEVHDPGVKDRARRFRERRTAAREHVTELAAYGLTLVAISVLMNARRVVDMRFGLPPDLLFDVTPAKLRGVETSGRATGGRSALLAVRDGTPATTKRPAKQGKAAQLVARTDITEAHLSLWCASPRISIMERVKP